MRVMAGTGVQFLGFALPTLPKVSGLESSPYYFQFVYPLDSWQKISEISGGERKGRHLPSREACGKVASQTPPLALPPLPFCHRS